jgi:hypothetical protein
MFIEVEDAPYFVTSIQRKKLTFGKGRVKAMISNGMEVPIDAEKLRYRNEKLYLDLGNGLKAKFHAAAFYDFMKDLSEDDEYYYIFVNGKRANLLSKAS